MDNNYYKPKSVVEIPLKMGFFLIKNLYSDKGHFIADKKAFSLYKQIINGRFKNQAINNEEKKLIEDLHELHIIIKKGEELKRIFSMPDSVEIWWHLTNKCNLRCKYCYVEKDQNSMSVEIIDYVIDKLVPVLKKSGRKNLKIKFSGGEALLEAKKLFYVDEKIKEVLSKHNIGYEAVIISNGTTLTAENIKKIKNNGIGLTISLDGSQKYHDAQRVYINGEGSYKNIIKNINLCLEHKIKPGISITITRSSVNGLPDLLSYLLKNKLHFSFNFVHNTSCKQASTKGLSILNYEKRFISSFKKVLKFLENNLPKEPIFNSLADRAMLNSFRDHTCAVCRSYFTIDHMGNIAKCQRKINEPITTVRDDNFFNKVLNSKESIQNPSVDEKSDCKDCVWKYICCGGCPMLAKEVYGSYYAKTPFCNIYKAILPEILRLEGLRVLKNKKWVK